MRFVAIDGVAWSVCVSVCWSRTWALQNGWTDQDAVGGRGGGADLRGPKEPCIRWGQDPQGKGAIFVVVRPIEKYWESAALYAAKGVIYLSIMSRRAMRPFIKTLWPLIMNLSHLRRAAVWIAVSRSLWLVDKASKFALCLALYRPASVPVCVVSGSLTHTLCMRLMSPAGESVWPSPLYNVWLLATLRRHVDVCVSYTYLLLFPLLRSV